VADACECGNEPSGSVNVGMWTGLGWPRIGTGGGRL